MRHISRVSHSTSNLQYVAQAVESGIVIQTKDGAIDNDVNSQQTPKNVPCQVPVARIRINQTNNVPYVDTAFANRKRKAEELNEAILSQNSADGVRDHINARSVRRCNDAEIIDETITLDDTISSTTSDTSVKNEPMEQTQSRVANNECTQVTSLSYSPILSK